MTVISGTVAKGLGGATESLSLQQLPFFKSKGLPATERLHQGTINLNISPKKFRVLSLDYFFKDIKWEKNRIEDFGFIKLESLTHQGIVYDQAGYIYIPYGSPHVDNSSQFEITSNFISSLYPGSIIEISIQEGKLEIS